jgi:hypothetical protein
MQGFYFVGFRHIPIGGNSHHRLQSDWRFAVLLVSLFNCLTFYSRSTIKEYNILFLESEYSVPCAEEPITGSYPEPLQFKLRSRD